MTTIISTRQEEIKLTAVRWFELLSRRAVDDLCAMTAPGWTMNGGLPGVPTGPHGIRKLMECPGSAKQRWIISDIIAERDKVVVHATNNYVQDMSPGIKGDGRSQAFSAVFIHHIVNGKIAETWRYADDPGKTLQTGGKLRPSSLCN